MWNMQQLQQDRVLMYNLFFMVAQLWLHLLEVPRLPRGLSLRLPRALRRLTDECDPIHALLIVAVRPIVSAPPHMARSTSSHYPHQRSAAWKPQRSAERRAMFRLHRLHLHRLRPLRLIRTLLVQPALEQSMLPLCSPQRYYNYNNRLTR